MKVIDIIAASRGPTFSVEIIPPARGRSVRDLIQVVEGLAPVDPKWIDVTSHCSTVQVQEESDGSTRRAVFKKRPGTIGICGIIQNRFKIDTVAHVLCDGFTREETEDALIELHYLGVENILALRGDGPNYDKPVSKGRSTNRYAVDLVKQAADLRSGQFIDSVAKCTSLDFCVGVAGYPEKHFEAANMDVDIRRLKEKVDAGAAYVVTQMFFDNQKFYAFVARCRKAGITVPIIPGLKILRSVKQLTSVPKCFYVELPSPFIDEIDAAPDHVVEISRRWAEGQVRDLLDNGYNNIHFYVMQDAETVAAVIRSVG